jgi:hypothetical protein
MSVFKRIWLEQAPEFSDYRHRCLQEAALDEFTFRLPAKRKNVIADKPYWCPLWAHRVVRAAHELNIEFRQINNGICFRSIGDRDAVSGRAELLWQADVAARMSNKAPSLR